MLGKVLIGILAVFLLLGAFASSILDGIKTWRTDYTTQYEVVTTGAGVTTANVTLDGDLFQASTSEVESVSSNITETPIASSYNEDDNHLLISALDASETRTLTLVYYAETGNTVMRAIGPFLAILVIGGLLGGIAYGMFKKGHR